jgi:hypothetical protein
VLQEDSTADDQLPTARRPMRRTLLMIGTISSKMKEKMVVLADDGVTSYTTSMHVIDR